MICPNCKKEIEKEVGVYKLFTVGNDPKQYCSLCIDDREGKVVEVKKRGRKPKV